MSARRDYDDRRSRSRKGGGEADAYDSYRKVTRRSPSHQDSRSKPAARRSVSRRRSDDRGCDRSRGRDPEDDNRRSDRRDDDRGRGRDDERGRGQADDRGRGRDDDRGRGRDDDRGRGRDEDRGRGRDDDRGRNRDRERDRDDGDARSRKKTGWGDDDKAKEAPPDWIKDLVGGGSADSSEMGGCGFGGPPPAGTRLNCKTIQIPVDAKPWLIGKGGKTINEIRAKTQSMIQINNNGPGDKMVTVMITGNVDMVEKLVFEHLEGWFTPSGGGIAQPNEAVMQQVQQLRVGAVKPMQLAPPVQLSAASIWNWNA